MAAGDGELGSKCGGRLKAPGRRGEAASVRRARHPKETRVMPAHSLARSRETKVCAGFDKGHVAGQLISRLSILIT